MARFVVLSCLFAMLGCRPPAGVESASDPAGKTGSGAGKTADATAHGTVVVTYMGVRYTVGASPQQVGDGWRVEVTVDVEIVDGQEHAFVRGKAAPSDEAHTSLRLSGSIDGPEGVSAFSEPAFSGHLELEKVPADVKTRFVRLFPSAQDKRLGVGDVLDLTVGIWGTEGPDGGQRHAPDLARLIVDVPAQGTAEVKIVALDPAKEPPSDSAVFEAGSHRVVVKPFYPYKQLKKSSSGGGITVLEAGETVVRIKDGELVVGQEHFGTLDPTAEVVVDGDEVTVDGKPRKGKELIKAKLLSFHPNPLTEHVLAGHEVFVSPGAGSVATMKEGGASKLVLDDTVLMIEDATLYVDGVSYGSIEKKARIKLFFGEVHVDGKEVEPVED